MSGRTLHLLFGTAPNFAWILGSGPAHRHLDTARMRIGFDRVAASCALHGMRTACGSLSLLSLDRESGGMGSCFDGILSQRMHGLGHALSLFLSLSSRLVYGDGISKPSQVGCCSREKGGQERATKVTLFRACGGKWRRNSNGSERWDQ